MHDCEAQTMDDYPCTEEGVVKVGNKWYCQYHARELDDFDLERRYPDAEEDTYQT